MASRAGYSNQASMREILKRMKLTQADDPEMLRRIFRWIEQQRPKFTYSQVLCLSLLMQRMARAFACRSTGAAVAPNSNVSPTSMSHTGHTATTSNANSNAAASSNTNTSTMKPHPSNLARKPRQKVLRSTKKLDLSPKVVESLKGFVADLALALPYIVKFSEANDPRTNYSRGRDRSVFTVVEIISLCLELLASDMRVLPGQRKSRGSPAGAMAIFREVLSVPTGGKEIDNTLDQLKFSKFSRTTLECSQKSSLDAVESYYDFSLMWSVAVEHHSLKPFPSEGTPQEKEDLARKLTYYIVWQRQEEREETYDRKERALAAATSMILLCVAPLLHYHPNSNTSTSEQRTPATGGATSLSSPNNNGKRSLEDDKVNNATASEGPPSKIPRVMDSGKIHDMNKPPPASGLITIPMCKACIGQERTLQLILRDLKNSETFFDWAMRAETTQKQGSVDGFTRAQLDESLMKVAKDLAIFSPIPMKDSYKTWVDVLLTAVGMKESGNPLPADVIESNFMRLCKDAFLDMHRNQEARIGTRVEVVSYIDEFNLKQATAKHDFLPYVCPTTKNHRPKKNEMIACVPHTASSQSLEMPDDPAQKRQQQQDLPASQVRRGVGQQQHQQQLPVSHGRTDVWQTKTGASTTGSSGIRQGEPASIPTGVTRSIPLDKSTFAPRKLAMEEENNPLVSESKVSPPVISDPMELNEWTIAVLASLTTIQPSANLRKRMDAVTSQSAQSNSPKTAGASSLPRWVKVIVPLLNRFLGRMREGVGNAAGGQLLMQVGPDGLVHTIQRTQDTQLWAAILQIYYHSLEAILHAERNVASANLVLNVSFHEALLACCYLCVSQAVTATGKMNFLLPENHTILNIMPITGCTPYTFLKVTESFLRASSTKISVDEVSKQLAERYGTLPRLLQKEVKNAEILVLESLVWARDHNPSLSETYIVNTIADIKQSSQWPPECLEPTLPEEIEDNGGKEPMQSERRPLHPEAAFVSFIMRKLLKVAYFRIQSICKLLGIPKEFPVASQVWLAFRFLLRNHVELLYGRHLDQFLLCTVYGICKVMKYQPILTFARIVDVYVKVRGKELGEHTCQAIVRHVKILDGTGDGDENGSDQSYGATKIGNIIRLYNLVYVSVMKGYLLHSKSLRRNAGILKKELAKKKANDKHENDFKSNNGSNDKVSAEVSEGNVTVRVTLHQPREKSTTWMMIDQEKNDLTMEKIPGARPCGQSVSLKFGQVSNQSLALANDVIAKAAQT